MKVICKDRRQKSQASAPEGRAVSSVSADVDRLLSPKTYEELETLELQINKKLRSNEPIDVDYWEQLLRSLIVWKAKAKLKKVYQSVIDSRLETLRRQQREEAETVRSKLQLILGGPKVVEEERDGEDHSTRDTAFPEEDALVTYSRDMDPEPLLKLRYEDKALDLMDEKAFLLKLVSSSALSLLLLPNWPRSATPLTLLMHPAQTAERRKILKLGFVPMRHRASEKPSITPAPKTLEPVIPGSSRFAAVLNDDFSQATKALYEREVARGVSENEEIFTGEEDITTSSKPLWANKHRPRKPRYFNRVQMGYEWNKYNQTHYDHDNPPPKVVQGYKFNIFYPDLIDRTRAPTYRIERENGRRRGQTFAPAGEEDTCLIRFIAGPPYEDIAFRIVDKEWDYSAKRERGFRSSFDKVCTRLSSHPLHRVRYRCLETPLTPRSGGDRSGMPPEYSPLTGLANSQGILQLHFQFKKVCASATHLRDFVLTSYLLDLLSEMKPSVYACLWQLLF
jgi:Cactus-binding C-terminus of cactin protein/Conserved mid region of cactin